MNFLSAPAIFSSLMMAPSAADPAASLWSRLETDFNSDDETANFGTRVGVKDKGGNMYDVVTLATCEPQSPATRDPSVFSASSLSSSLLAIAIASCVHVIKTEEDVNEAEEDKFAAVSVIFSACVDCLCWSPCGRFVVAGLRSGKVQMLHVNTRKTMPPMDVDGGDENEAWDEGQTCFVGCSIATEQEEERGETTVKVNFAGANGQVS